MKKLYIGINDRKDSSIVALELFPLRFRVRLNADGVGVASLMPVGYLSVGFYPDPINFLTGVCQLGVASEYYKK